MFSVLSGGCLRRNCEKHRLWVVMPPVVPPAGPITRKCKLSVRQGRFWDGSKGPENLRRPSQKRHTADKLSQKSAHRREFLLDGRPRLRMIIQGFANKVGVMRSWLCVRQPDQRRGRRHSRAGRHRRHGITGSKSYKNTDGTRKRRKAIVNPVCQVRFSGVSVSVAIGKSVDRA